VVQHPLSITATNSSRTRTIWVRRPCARWQSGSARSAKRRSTPRTGDKTTAISRKCRGASARTHTPRLVRRIPSRPRSSRSLGGFIYSFPHLFFPHKNSVLDKCFAPSCVHLGASVMPLQPGESPQPPRRARGVSWRSTLTCFFAAITIEWLQERTLPLGVSWRVGGTPSTALKIRFRSEPGRSRRARCRCSKPWWGCAS
jgi:hypothetical protein